MTATASPKGRPPLQLPSPPRKPMPAGHRQGKRASCLGLSSCFGGSSVADSARHRRAPWFTWSKFQKKKKTVPVDSSATELIPEKATTGDNCRPPAAGVDKSAGKGGHGAEEEEPRKQQPQHMAPTKTPILPPPAVELPSQSYLWRLWKGNKDRGGHKTQLSRSHKDRVLASNHEQQQRPPPPEQQHCVPHISPRYDSRRRVPAPFPPEPARTATTRPCVPRTAQPSPPAASSTPATTKPPPNHATTTSRLGSARSHKKREEPSSTSSSSGLPAGRNDQVVGLSVMVVVLVMMLLFGRVSAVICTCLWFYCLPRLRATLTETNGGGSKSSAGVDFDSEEYKKKVVLEGLLQRNARRPPGLP